jgi:hypothetical protein
MTNTKTYRRALLQGTGAVLLVSFGVTPAMAATGDATIDAVATAGAADTSTSVGQIAVDTPLFKSADTTATASAITGSVVSSGTMTGTVSVLNNVTSALASANIAASTVGLEILSSDALADGIAVSSTSRNTGAVNAYASNQTIAADLTGFESGAVAVDGNRVTATTSINSTTQTISGAAPIGYVSPATTEGSAVVNADAATAAEVTNLAATIVASTVQKSFGVNSGAYVGTDGTTVAPVNFNLALNGAANAGVTGSASLDSNIAAATFSANTAVTTIGLGAADGSLAGTAVVGNVQSTGNGAQLKAENIDTNVTASVTETTFDNTFAGSSLSVASNRISSTASANVATDSIILADGLAYTGSGFGNDSFAVLATDANTARGDLVIASSQLATEGSGLSASTSAADITATVENSVNSTIDLSLNRVTATATGNSLTSSVDNGTGSASFSAAVTLVGEQVNTSGSAKTATVTDANIAAIVGIAAATAPAGVVSGSDVSVSGNITSASATGNALDQAVMLDATTLALGTGTASATTTTPVAGNGLTSAGALTVGSVQISTDGSGATANNTNSQVSLTSNDAAGTSSGSAFLVSTNTQEAFATGSKATNNVSLAGNSVGSEVAVISLQQNLNGSEATASLTSGASLVVNGSLGGAASATAELSGNIARAIATGATVSNALNVDAQTVAVTANNAVAVGVAYDGSAVNGQAFDLSGTPTVTAAYALLNDQAVIAGVQATATPVSFASAFLAQVNTDVAAGSSVDNNRNTLAAQAQGAVATNSTNLAVGSLSSTGYAPIASVTNVQAMGDSTVRATAGPLNSGTVVLTELNGLVTDASIATSSNVIAATADSTKSVNRLAVTSTTLTAAEGALGTAGLVTVTDGFSTADAAFTVVNAQASGTNSTAAMLFGGGDSARVLTDITGVISGSSVESSSNLLSALANANDTVNSLSLSANSLQTTAALLNAQVSETSVQATADNSNTRVSVSIAVGDDIANSSVAVDSNVIQVSAISNVASNALGVSATSIIGDGASTVAAAGLLTGTTFGSDADYVLANDQTNSGSAGARSSGLFSIDQTQTGDPGITDSSLSVSGNSQLAEAGSNFATSSVSVSATDLDAGVAEQASAGLSSRQVGVANVSANSNLWVFTNISSTGSTIDLNSNSNAARGFINTASNTLAVAGTNIASASAADATVTTGTSNLSTADYALSNIQAGTGGITTFATLTVFNADLADAATPGVVDGNVSLSLNTNAATSTVNAGTNAVMVNTAASPGASVSTVAALGNNQNAALAGMDVLSGSNAEFTATLNGTDPTTATLDNSTLSVDGNTDRSTSVLNTATNSLSVYGANIASVGTTNTNAVADSTTGSVVTADFALNNVQATTTAGGAALYSFSTLIATAGDRNGGAASGVVGSDLSVSSNLSRAEANANSASNTVTVSADAQLGATAALGNDQSNAVGTEADATSTVNGVAGGTLTQDALNGSSLAVAGNSTTAVARGNTATNAMTYAAGANYGTSDIGATVTDTASTATASAVVLNAQSNTANITATGNATYAATAANVSGATGAGVLNSTVRVANNAVNAFAFGNSAVNSLVMTALNTGMPTAAVSSNQSNSAAVVASVTGAFTINGTGTVGSSSLAVIGNLVGAQAIGNSSTTIIIGR